MRRYRRVLFMATSAIAALCTGCQFGEAVADGAFGGISDTVAGVISGVLLGALGV